MQNGQNVNEKTINAKKCAKKILYSYYFCSFDIMLCYAHIISCDKKLFYT